VNAKNLQLTPAATLTDAMTAITREHSGIVVVCDGDGRLLGTVTDGDIRRAIIGGAGLDAAIGKIANASPVVVPQGTTKEDMLDLMRARRKQALPVVDAAGCVLDIALLSDLMASPVLSNHAVVMAGGFGRRMRPYTETIPKPMLKVGGRPMLELLLEGLVSQGVRKIILLLHYKPEMIIAQIQAHGFDGADIEFLVEDKPLGTAGGLALARDRLTEPFLVLNSDCLTRPNWAAMLETHRQKEHQITVGCSEYSVQVPYGVLQVDEDLVGEIREKPVQTWLTVCGAYCLSPAALDLLPDAEPFDMPDMVSSALDRKARVGYFRMDGVTRIEDLASSHGEVWRNGD